MVNFLKVLLFAAFLGGCAGDAVTSIKQNIKESIRAKITAANQLAVAAKDRPAMMCYSYLLDNIPEDTISVPTTGAIVAFQKARNIRRRFQGGISDDFRIACSALFGGSRAALLRVARRLLPGL